MWAQIAPYSLLVFQYLATAWGARCLPCVDWLLATSASSEATLVPGWGSTLTLFTFWKTQKKPQTHFTPHKPTFNLKTSLWWCVHSTKHQKWDLFNQMFNQSHKTRNWVCGDPKIWVFIWERVQRRSCPSAVWAGSQKVFCNYALWSEGLKHNKSEAHHFTRRLTYSLGTPPHSHCMLLYKFI